MECKLLFYVYFNKQKDEKLMFLVFLSDSLGARTQDPILKRDVLYLLS